MLLEEAGTSFGTLWQMVCGQWMDPSAPIEFCTLSHWEAYQGLKDGSLCSPFGKFSLIVANH